MQYEQAEIPRYKKKKPQVSSAAKHSKHKHEYVKTISLFINTYKPNDPALASAVWTRHCSVCGRYNGFVNGDLLSGKDPSLHKTLANGDVGVMSVAELMEKYPGTPIYTNKGEYLFPQERVV